MRNLKLASHCINDIKIPTKVDSILCIDPVTAHNYAVNTTGIFNLSKEQSNTSFTEKLWEDESITLSKVIGAEVITSLSSLCIISIEGDVLTVTLEDGFTDVVGSVSDGILASGWSPDQEILVVVTGKLSVILMTADFEPLVELFLEQDDFGESKFINVGWGKKETQFHGAVGKQAARETKIEATKVFEWDKKEPKISWRGDGQFFAISYVNSSNVRKLRIVNREGVLQSTSEDLEGLEDCLCWKPSGNLITSSQRLSNKHNIVFFEKNGLQHGGFAFPFSAMERRVREVLWNTDSSVLTVWLEPFQSNVTVCFIQLWKTGNHHWYLKEELTFTEPIQDVKWDPEHALNLHLLTSYQLHNLRFLDCIDTSRGRSSCDNAVVGVIDGKNLLVTPFRHSIVPPPLSAYEILFQTQIHAIIYPLSSALKLNYECPENSLSIEDSGFLDFADSQVSNCNSLCVYHGRDTLTFLMQAQPDEQLSDFDVKVTLTGVGGNGFRSKNPVHRVIAQCKLESGSLENLTLSPETVYNWSWSAKNSMVTSYRKGNQNYVVIFELEGIGTDNSKAFAKSVIDIEDEVVSISSFPDLPFVCLQLVTGELLKLNLADESVTPWIENGVELKFPVVCDQVLLCPVGDDSHIPLGLTSRNRLYLGNKQILSDCTSIHLHTDHVLMTTTSHSLLVVPMTVDALSSLTQGVQDEYTAVGVRRVERGSRIVTAVPDDTKVLLQMPRGNLELIHPRPLTVHILKRLLDAKNYDTAMDLMRKQRIDMNLVYDHNPEFFLTNVEEFVSIVDNPQWIDLLIASLNNNDLTKTIYSYLYRHRNSGSTSNSKVDVVCQALRIAMVSVDEEKFLLPILSTYVKSPRGEMHLALLKLKEMKKSGKEYKVNFEEGLRHILYVADANELCDVALGTYDFELVMLIYGRSQKDPKEYLPFLKSFMEMEENYRIFRINVHLKRFKRALEAILSCSDEHNDECLSLIKKEQLYRDALETFPKGSSLYNDSCVAYADYFIGKGYDNEAASMYVRGGHLESALDAYVRATNWKSALTTAFQLKLSDDKFRRLCSSLAEKLKSQNCFADAAAIYQNYIRREEDAVTCLCQAHLWEDALLIASKLDRPDLIETDIEPSLLEHFHAIDDKIQECLSSFRNHLQRLIIVRSKKVEEYRDLLHGQEDSQLDPDLYSDSSTVTGFSRRSIVSRQWTNVTSGSSKTYRSSKNKRKLEKKKYSIKEGSAFEDLGLVVAIHELMSSIHDLSNTVSDTNRALLRFDEDAKAKKLQKDFELLIEEMQKNKFTVWCNCSTTSEDDGSLEFGPQMTTESAVKQIRGVDCEKGNTYVVQRLNELEPHFRYPPNLDKIRGWKLYSLR